MIITWFHAGSSRSGNSVDLAFFSTNEEGKVIDACPIIARTIGIQIRDDFKRGFFFVRTTKSNMQGLFAKIRLDLNCKIVRG